MGYETIKLELIEWLTKLQDTNTIEYLKIVKDSRISGNDWWNDLTEGQKTAIERGLEEIKEGKVVAHEEVVKKYGL